MKEFEVSLEEDLLQGLRRFSITRADDKGLMECFNLAPAELGVELHEIVVNPTDTKAYLLESAGMYIITESDEKIRLV